LARELTKKFEEILRCTLKEAIEKYENESPRGEYVLVVEGADEKQIIEDKRVMEFHEYFGTLSNVYR